MIAALVPSTMSAHDFMVDGIYYNIKSGGVNINYGNEVSVTYEETGYNSYTGDVIIPAEVTFNATTYYVTEIGVSAFRDCTGLTSITIPYSVIAIGDEAFRGCTGLTTTDIPNSVTTIGGYAFEGCSGLTTIDIPNSVTTIGSGAFGSCQGLTSIAVESGNTVYDSRDNCNAIIETASNTLLFGCMNSVIPNSVTSIGSFAFDGCTGLTCIDIPNSVTSIGWSAFNCCTGLTSIDIPNSVTSLGTYAFYFCTSLANVSIGNSVTSIGIYTFWKCSSLSSINIPSSVTSIGSHAFDFCSGLTSITVAIDNPFYDSRDNCNAIIKTANNTLIAGCMNTTIPNSVTSIGNYAFNGCTDLTNIDIPNPVTTIGLGAFYNCTGLTSVTIPNSVTFIRTQAFENCFKLNDVYCHVADPSLLTLETDAFGYIYNGSNAGRTLHVPAGSLAAYQAGSKWSQYFETIVEMGHTAGDVNGDGELTISDVTGLIDLLLSGGDLPAYADVNGDGVVTIKDVTDMIDMLLSGDL